MTMIELILSTAIKEAGEVYDVRLMKEDAEAILEVIKRNEPRTGFWKSVPHKRARVCSVCEADEPYKFADDDADVYDFCPHCGAKMTGSR